MLKKIVLVTLALVALGMAVVAGGLTWAHMAIRRERGALPPPAALTAANQGGDLPVRLSLINTTSQPMPRSAVLDPAQDPQPQARYVMSHPSFVFEWADERVLLVDVGMDREGARSFGRPLQTLAGADPIDPQGSVAERLGPAATRVRGIVFTHLHTDHVGGIGELCRSVSQPVQVFMTEAQDQRPNYTTRPGRGLLRAAPCVQTVPLGAGPLRMVPGFPGVYVVGAGGHTPGSQMIAAFVQRDRGVQPYVLVGDIVNNIDGISHDIPKPFLYRLLMVPEDETRLGELRRFIRGLRDDEGFTVLVSHDQLDLERSGVSAWQAALRTSW